jgi:RNA polymerase sigma-70 factor (ECF subfamily)
MTIDPDLNARYRAIVMQLPPLNREVFVLHCIDELEFREIASRLEVSVRTVESALAQALVQIDRELEQGDNPD